MKLPLGDFLFGMWNYLWWSVEYVRFWKTFCALLGLFFHRPQKTLSIELCSPLYQIPVNVFSTEINSA